MNRDVRPFTAKWHRKAADGRLGALDASDEFRAELGRLQRTLRSLDTALRLVTGAPGYEPGGDRLGPEADQIEGRISRPVAWRPAGIALGDTDCDPLATAEKRAVGVRRDHYGVNGRDWAAGIALSGGGIRSATFSMGVMAALARRDLLPQFDYLSTVSGGGYAGSFLTQLLGSPGGADLGLRGCERPFRRAEGESEILRSLRQRARYLAATPLERVFVAMRQVYGLFVNLVLLLIVTAAFAYIDAALRPVVDYGWSGWLAVALPL